MDLLVEPQLHLVGLGHGDMLDGQRRTAVDPEGIGPRRHLDRFAADDASPDHVAAGVQRSEGGCSA